MMAAIVGAMQVETGLRRLLEQKEPGESVATNLEISLDPVQKVEAFSLSLSQTCPFHAPRGSRFAPSEPASRLTVRRLLEEVVPASEGATSARLLLDWPICASARCQGCRHRWAPMLRVATLRKCAECPACGSPQFSAEEVIHTVDRQSRWADFTLESLGIPDRHLHRIEFGSELIV